MNCNCLTQIEEKMLNKFYEDNRYKKPVLKVEIEKGLIFGKELTTRTYCSVEIELEGQKKKVKQNLMHTYCPFCGVKVEKEELQAANSN